MLPPTFDNEDSLNEFCDNLYADREQAMCTISDVDTGPNGELIYQVVMPRCPRVDVTADIRDDTLVVAGKSTKYGEFRAEYQCNNALYSYDLFESNYSGGILTVKVPRIGKRL